MINIDTRVQYTKSRFHDAMTELLWQKSIGFITIKELCDTAGLNRGTFYLHYSQPLDVLQEMENELTEDVLATLMTDLSGMSRNLREPLSLLLANRRTAAAVIGHNGNPDFLSRVHSTVYEKQRHMLQQQFPDRSPQQIAYTFSYLFAGCTGVVKEWLVMPEPTPAEEMEKLLSDLTESVLNTLQ
ncbi:MAG: TetR/AcrR family transcriptional regulator [Oscillospiraceae bacterium]|nr:TetR/AcrR family transcriptional regulator [Oscillospiraceae bacterium]